MIQSKSCFKLSFRLFTLSLSLLVFVVLLFGCLQLPGQNIKHAIGTNVTGSTSQNQSDISNSITKAMCEQYRGHWNDCASACRGAPEGTICTMQCVQVCECGGIAGFNCPPQFVCTNYLPSKPDGTPMPDAMGICKRGTSY